jgi:hypothetical protein
LCQTKVFCVKPLAEVVAMATPAAILDEFVPITGGHLKARGPRAGSDQHSIWLAKRIYRSIDNVDVPFVELVRADPKFRQFVKADFRVLDRMMALRNRAIKDESETPTANQDDPLEDVAPKRAKKEFAAGMPAIISIKMTFDDGRENLVRVLSAQSNKTRLSMELTGRNLDLLNSEELADFDDEDDPFVPENLSTESSMVIRWAAARRSIYCRYYNSADAKWRHKYTAIKGYGGDEERFQQAVARAIRVLEAFYAEHHEQPIDTDDALLVEHHGVEHHGVESVAESGLP